MVCSPFSSLLLSQQFTNLAAVFAHSCLSPSRNGSFSSLVIFTNSLWVCVNCGKYVSLMSWYSGQVVRKCSSVSTTFCVQWVHSLSSLGRGVCLWRPFSIARLWSLYLVKAIHCFTTRGQSVTRTRLHPTLHTQHN